MITFLWTVQCSIQRLVVGTFDFKELGNGQTQLAYVLTGHRVQRMNKCTPLSVNKIEKKKRKRKMKYISIDGLLLIYGHPRTKTVISYKYSY